MQGFLGRHAQSPAISTSTEVIVYFGKAQEGFKPNLPGIVWIYDEAHVVVLSKNVYCPPKLTLMLDPMLTASESISTLVMFSALSLS